MSNERKMPPLASSDERKTCLELGNLLLGLNFTVIEEFRTRKSADREQFAEAVKDALKTFYQTLNISDCPCGDCGGGRCCVCPSVSDHDHYSVSE